MGSTDESVRRLARVLTGFMSDEEAMGFASSFVLDPQRFLMARQAQAARRPPLAPSLTKPRIEDLPGSMQFHAAQVRSNPIFPAMYGDKAVIQLVELGKLIAFQLWMDTDVSDGVHGAGVSGPPEQEHVLRTCLPTEIVPPTRTWWQQVQNGVAVYSMNNTFTVGAVNVNQAQGQVTFALSAGANLMMVRECGGRYILANGYHRAWLLRSRGVEMAPAVVVSVGEAGIGGGIDPGVLLGPRPPVVDDFLDDSLSLSVEVRAMLRMVKITAEVSPVPRLI